MNHFNYGIIIGAIESAPLLGAYYIFDSSYCLGNIIAFFARMAAGYAIESIDPGKDFSMREVYGLDPALSK